MEREKKAGEGGAAMRSPMIAGLLVLLAAEVVFLFRGNNHSDLVARFQEEIDNLRGGLGGPGSPSHPLPADDSKLLNRKRRDADGLR